MINSFELKFCPFRNELALTLFCNSFLVAELYIESVKNLEINCYSALDSNEFWLQPSSLNNFVNVDFPLDPQCAKSLYDLIEDFPTDFTSFKFASGDNQ